MTDGEALLSAIIAAPDEDTPRLVYADWLQENGRDARAEFIRVQVELAGLLLPHPPPRGANAICVNAGSYRTPQWVSGHDLPRLGALRDREFELIDEYGFDWFSRVLRGFEMMPCLNPDPALVRHGCGDMHPARVRRGFVESVTCTAADWLAHGDALCWHPSQTVPCRECSGRGFVSDERPDWKCQLCGGRKSFPRPCPATAQPVRKVTLTSLGVYTPSYEESVLQVLRSHWPGVEVELPAASIGDAEPGTIFTLHD